MGHSSHRPEYIFPKLHCGSVRKVVQSYNHVGDRELIDNAWFFEPEPADLAAKMIYEGVVTK